MPLPWVFVGLVLIFILYSVYSYLLFQLVYFSLPSKIFSLKSVNTPW